MEPSYDDLSALIKLAGGEVLTEIPKPQLMIDCIEVEYDFLNNTA